MQFVYWRVPIADRFSVRDQSIEIPSSPARQTRNCVNVSGNDYSAGHRR